jgi:hypothetical protein
MDGENSLGFECWTITSTRSFAADNKVPQENIPPEVDMDIKAAMLAEFEKISGSEERSFDECDALRRCNILTIIHCHDVVYVTYRMIRFLNDAHAHAPNSFQ